MEIRNVTRNDLISALASVNEDYEDNVTWNRFEMRGNAYFVTLRVKDCRKKGHRIGHYTVVTGIRRRLVSACWHVHGDFFDALLTIQPKAVVKTSFATIFKNEYGRTQGNWTDRNIGSIMYPLYYSEACECFISWKGDE